MSSRLYYADVAVGDKVLSKTEVRFRDSSGIHAIAEGSRAVVTALENSDALVVFDEAPEVLLRLGLYELRRAR